MALMRLCSCERATKPEKVIQANRDAGLETCPELFCPKKTRLQRRLQRWLQRLQVTGQLLNF